MRKNFVSIAEISFGDNSNAYAQLHTMRCQWRKIILINHPIILILPLSLVVYINGKILSRIVSLGRNVNLIQYWSYLCLWIFYWHFNSFSLCYVTRSIWDFISFELSMNSGKIWWLPAYEYWCAWSIMSCCNPWFTRRSWKILE